ncbi:CDP-diacylglycerol--glycerol-3-phosphate 3-phosphatidyltransferase [Clostridium ganghwense]|uniref:CDP-diacylglycerol--glycerol-3-phosphate 3-phosphatidyltransferase n=1 Tax=Clostridium ganghwense TaxID=312089 RepID=A0ABT4CSS4_9CLOT|nr:CDP-diacylglycerol--glycerol-3-phosphate 3-phosphatidyltransferase [Clostridium ganghwense]MCY6372128.1 CDP-diacylglycerol--glycerol-3-phosphate 3-phosphatidyltransferase [Clostridium ganghwense]
MNIPNTLTLVRLFLIPIFVLFFFSGETNSLTNATLIFLIAGLTDVLDGYIARKYNLITKWGTVLDPLADKLMLVTVLTCLFLRNYIPLWVVLIIAIKEFLMISAGISFYRKDVVFPADGYGKIATLVFYIGILYLPFHSIISNYLIYLGVAVSILAFVNYLLKVTRKFKV